MLIGFAFLLCLLTVPLARGGVHALAQVRLRARSLALTGLGIQVLIISVFPGGDQRVHAVAHVASYVLVGCFVAANWTVPYLWLIALGGALNAVAIGFNGGVMPADPGALAAAGIANDPQTFSNSTAVADPVLLFLGDVMWIPESWPMNNVFSIGDVLIVAGAFLALHTISGSRLAFRRLAVLARTRAPQTSPV